MTAVNAIKAQIKGDKLHISTRFRNFIIERDQITTFKIHRIPSLFDEIGIELHGDRVFLVTERATGFFELADFLRLERAFGPFWYRDAESGRELCFEGWEFGAHD